ncbi:protein SAWADEE HOMEODOMAIN HOMOLOG 1 [Corylus avellana]|uniref:protein SAWADEE HOMEODOMAIN HOMOLOG 1 n=1 Tax=Corylus avellana TaxID=13451 RepID=UPI00286C9F61|nr:protein SAWADEE HOMEODOMAIN HOMOLOG 1 [Corylus avellana]
MDGFGPNNYEDSIYEFTIAEIIKLENIFKEIAEQSVGQEFCQDIATSFSCSASRAGKSAITWEQVQTWFQNRQEHSEARQEQLEAKVTSSSGALKLFVDTSDAHISSNAPESCPTPKGTKVSDISELQFEAKSSKDNAWYDVASFLTYRVASRGELEVRVRFAGFGKHEDEWVNVKRAVRERSIPLEPSECSRVKVGDLVLCFQEREDHAVYCDAYVVEIQRKLHDIRGCRCTFVVRYDHDNTLEKVQLGWICGRPTQCSASGFGFQAEPTQYDSQSAFDIPEGVKFPF